MEKKKGDLVRCINKQKNLVRFFQRWMCDSSAEFGGRDAELWQKQTGFIPQEVESITPLNYTDSIIDHEIPIEKTVIIEDFGTQKSYPQTKKRGRPAKNK
jgi:hypothetical protein